MTVIVLAGGLSHERDVSLHSGRRVAQALRRQGLDVCEADVSVDLLGLLSDTPDPVVVPLLHGGLGENGALAEVLQLLGVPYVGSHPRAARNTFDKSLATPLLAAHGIATPRHISLPATIFRELGAPGVVAGIAKQFGFPLMVKPSSSGSALGMTRVPSEDELPAAMVAAYAYGPNAVIEEFVEGTELAVTIIDAGEAAKALPPVEIHPASGVYDFEAKYTAGSTRFTIPPELPDSVLERAKVLALRAHTMLGLSGISRIDLIVSNGLPIFIEANVCPGMTETSSAPLAMAAAGLDLGEVYVSLIKAAQAKAA
ncbi:MAG: D-alanine--D-alanine ligase [Arachnia propionica]|nr:MAG: D-alanine--D-alanine ligase [Arachnia propionica]